jgi:hypothetical protein
MSHFVTIDASPKQLSKLRNGHPVRIKRGTGFNLLVHPETYNVVNRAFAKDKGIQIKLSQEELQANADVSPEQFAQLKEANPEIAGEGIFGKRFDKALEKRGLKKTAYNIGRELKPGVKAGIISTLAAGGTALGALQPELIPFILPAVGGLSSLASSYLDNPDQFQGYSGLKGKSMKNMAQQVVSAQINDRVNQQMGTNYDYMSRAGLENAKASAIAQALSNESINSRRGMTPEEHTSIYGYGIMGRGKSLIGNNGGFVHHSQPALVSQPLGANFQMQHFMPPQYQHLHNMSGEGLYAGKGFF